MCKALGIIMTFFSCACFLYRIVNERREQTNNLKEIKKAVIYLKNELAFSMPEMISLCEKTAKKTTGEISLIFERVSEYMCEDSCVDFYSAWQRACGEKKLFSPETERAVTELFAEFGKKTLDIELHNVSRVQHILEEREKEEEKKYMTDRKLIYTLGVAFCTVTVIIAI